MIRLERELDTKKFEGRSMGEFDKDPSCGGYGILNQIGHTDIGTLAWQDDKDVKSRYKRLLEMRRA